MNVIFFPVVQELFDNFLVFLAVVEVADQLFTRVRYQHFGLKNGVHFVLVSVHDLL